MMNLVMVLVVSLLFAQCKAYQVPILLRLGRPAPSILAIHPPGSWKRVTTVPNPPLRPSHSPWRLFSMADQEDGKDLAFSSLDRDLNETAFGTKCRPASSFVDDDDDEMARAGIPEEIKNNQYASERELRMDLEKWDLGDLRIILDQDGFPIWRERAGKEHVGAVGTIIDRLDKWKKGKGQSIKGSKAENVFVNDSFNKPKNEKRCPDLAIFGPDRLEDYGIRIVDGDFMNPHVIIQFSWTNTITKEKCAIDDMMHFAGIGEYIHLGRPNVAYLIKALRRGTSSPEAPVYGFDIFQVGQDQCTPDEPTMKYRVGGQEDTVIRIPPASMGLLDDEGEPFTIEMSAIRERLELFYVTFDPALEHEL